MHRVLDSNVWIEAAAGLPHAVRALADSNAAGWCGFSAISRLEVLGFPNLSQTEENSLIFLLSQFHEVQVSSEIIDRAIQLRRRVKIKVPDAIVAATALHLNAELITRNTADFQKIMGLVVRDTLSF